MADDWLPARVEWCDKCPQRATYIAFKDDLDLTLCDHHTFTLVQLLVDKGFSLQMLPGVRTRLSVG